MRWRQDHAQREISNALVQACAGPGRSQELGVTATGIPDLVAAARFHRIAPLVHAAFKDTGPDGLRVLQADRFRAVATHLQACAALDELAVLLDDVEWVTFKGPVFSESAHPVGGIRTYNDVDVLVASTSLREVCRRLRDAGWQLVDMLRSDPPPGEMHWVSPAGVLVDLHWSMINMHSRRRLFDVPTPALLARRVRARTQSGSAWWTLDPADSLVHACLHASLSGANKLVYLVDVDRLTRDVSDWDEVVARARAWRATSQVALVLGRASRVLGTSFPEGLERRLGVPPSLRALMALTDRLAPVQDGRHGEGLPKFVARAARPGAGGTLLACVRHAARGLSERVMPRPAPKERRPADAASLDVFLGSVERAGAGPV